MFLMMLIHALADTQDALHAMAEERDHWIERYNRAMTDLVRMKGKYGAVRQELHEARNELQRMQIQLEISQNMQRLTARRLCELTEELEISRAAHLICCERAVDAQDELESLRRQLAEAKRR